MTLGGSNLVLVFLVVVSDKFCVGAEFEFNDGELDAEQLPHNHKRGQGKHHDYFAAAG